MCDVMQAVLLSLCSDRKQAVTFALRSRAERDSQQTALLRTELATQRHQFEALSAEVSEKDSQHKDEMEAFRVEAATELRAAKNDEHRVQMELLRTETAHELLAEMAAASRTAGEALREEVSARDSHVAALLTEVTEAHAKTDLHLTALMSSCAQEETLRTELATHRHQFFCMEAAAVKDDEDQVQMKLLCTVEELCGENVAAQGSAAELRSERDEYQVLAAVLLSEKLVEQQRVEDLEKFSRVELATQRHQVEALSAEVFEKDSQHKGEMEAFRMEAAAELRWERDEYQVQAAVLLSEKVAEQQRVEDLEDFGRVEVEQAVRVGELGREVHIEVEAECQEIVDSLLARHSELEAVAQEGQRRSDVESLCVVCQDSPRSVVSLPCRHRVLCTSCLQRLQQPECPMCRSRISSSLEVLG